MAESIVSTNYKIKVLKLICSKNNSPIAKNLNVYQYNNWNEYSAVEISDIESLLQVINTQRNKCNPLAIHCRTGVGRTGTFIALDIIKNCSLITSSYKADILVRSIMEQRHQAVQTKTQYQLIHAYAIHARK